MFTYYQSQVLLAYREKKATYSLSLNLAYPTPSKLKAECIAVLNERYRTKDERTLKSLLGTCKNATAYMQAFKKLDADKLKPIDNFLKEKTNNTDEKNIELLAWLIDFEPRPYQLDWNYKDPHLLRPLTENINQGFTDNTIGPSLYISDNEGVPIKKSTLKKEVRLTVILLLIVVIIAGIYLLWPNSLKEGCMYWAGNNFQSVSCTTKKRDTLIFALDTFKLNHFKRLNNPDTITLKAIGRVWYIKTHNKLEFFTSKGFYPPDPKRDVKPLSPYMIETYILTK